MDENEKNEKPGNTQVTGIGWVHHAGSDEWEANLGLGNYDTLRATGSTREEALQKVLALAEAAGIRTDSAMQLLELDRSRPALDVDQNPLEGAIGWSVQADPLGGDLYFVVHLEEGFASGSGRTAEEAKADLIRSVTSCGSLLSAPEAERLIAELPEMKDAPRIPATEPPEPELAAPFDFNLAFREGAVLAEFTRYFDGPVTLDIVHAGYLALLSGVIVARDPHVPPDPEADERSFLETVPPGRYPVLLSVARGGPQKRVVCAELRFLETPAVVWRQALTARAMEPRRSFRYGVDSGMGCFADVEAARLLSADFWCGGDLSERVDLGTRTHANVVLDPATGLNVIAMHSGWGDGGYASYFGYDADGRTSCLVTDFELFEPAAWTRMR